MAIRTVRTFPLRSRGLTQDEYSTGVENSLTDLPLAIKDFNAAASAFQLAVTGTSTTSVLIGTGSKSFTTQTGLGFVVGMALRIANSSANYMTGDVTSYNTGTGALVVNVTAVVGSGTLASWTISLAAVGANTAGTVSNTPAGNISATNVQAAINELDTEKLSSASGAVTGTNLEDIISAGSVGTTANIPVITYDVNGRITVASTVAKITSSSTIATTSSTSHDVAVASNIKKITLLLSGISISGTDNIQVQLGDSGGIETTGYLGATSNATTTSNFTTGLGLTVNPAAANLINGIVTICLLDAATNLWAMHYVGGMSNTATCYFAASSKALSAALTTIRLTVTGANTFDAGSISVLTE